MVILSNFTDMSSALGHLCSLFFKRASLLLKRAEDADQQIIAARIDNLSNVADQFSDIYKQFLKSNEHINGQAHSVLTNIIETILNIMSNFKKTNGGKISGHFSEYINKEIASINNDVDFFRDSKEYENKNIFQFNSSGRVINILHFIEGFKTELRDIMSLYQNSYDVDPSGPRGGKIRKKLPEQSVEEDFQNEREKGRDYHIRQDYEETIKNDNYQDTEGPEKIKEEEENAIVENGPKDYKGQIIIDPVLKAQKTKEYHAKMQSDPGPKGEAYRKDKAERYKEWQEYNKDKFNLPEEKRIRFKKYYEEIKLTHEKLKTMREAQATVNKLVANNQIGTFKAEHPEEYQKLYSVLSEFNDLKKNTEQYDRELKREQIYLNHLKNNKNSNSKKINRSKKLDSFLDRMVPGWRN